MRCRVSAGWQRPFAHPIRDAIEHITLFHYSREVTTLKRSVLNLCGSGVCLTRVAIWIITRMDIQHEIHSFARDLSRSRHTHRRQEVFLVSVAIFLSGAITVVGICSPFLPLVHVRGNTDATLSLLAAY